MDDPLVWEPYDRHWIRLRGPWDVTWIAPAADDETADRTVPGRVTLPAGWSDLFGERAGTARFLRRFQCPTNLDDDERVVITLCDVRCEVSAQLNEAPLRPLASPIGDPESAPCEDSLSFDITEIIETGNRLSLDLTVVPTQIAQAPCGLWRPVLLEVITPS